MSSLEHRYLEFLFLAYTAVWVVMFGFLYRMMGRAKRLERDVAVLRDAWMTPPADEPAADNPVDPRLQGPSV